MATTGTRRTWTGGAGPFALADPDRGGRSMGCAGNRHGSASGPPHDQRAGTGLPTGQHCVATRLDAGWHGLRLCSGAGTAHGAVGHVGRAAPARGLHGDPKGAPGDAGVAAALQQTGRPAVLGSGVHRGNRDRPSSPAIPGQVRDIWGLRPLHLDCSSGPDTPRRSLDLRGISPLRALSDSTHQSWTSEHTDVFAQVRYANLPPGCRAFHLGENWNGAQDAVANARGNRRPLRRHRRIQPLHCPRATADACPAIRYLESAFASASMSFWSAFNSFACIF
jgi:hypothetical protein